MSERQEVELDLARAYVREARRRCSASDDSKKGENAVRYLRASLDLLTQVQRGIPSGQSRG